MTPQTVFIFIAAIAMLNGVLPPYLTFALEQSPIWFPGALTTSPAVLLYGSSLFVSAATLLVGGVPAALYERFAGTGKSTPVSMTIWLVTVAAISFPSFAELLAGR